MAEKTEEIVRLTAPNGAQVSVAESKVEARIAAGYQRLSNTSKPAAKKAAASKSE